MKAKEREALESARKMARQIGDKEWQQGHTKYALESYEVSDIELSELHELAVKLVKAEQVAEGAWKNKTLKELDSKDCNASIRHEIFKILGWDNLSPNRHSYYPDSFFCCSCHWLTHIAEIRAARVACLKLIDRLSYRREHLQY